MNQPIRQHEDERSAPADALPLKLARIIEALAQARAQAWHADVWLELAGA